MRRDREQLRACAVVPAEHKRRANITLVLEKALLQQRHRRDHARTLACVQLVELDVARNQVCHKLGIRRCARTATPDMVRDIVNLLAVFVGHDGALRGPRVGAEHDAIFVDQAHDRGTGARRTRYCMPFCGQGCVACMTGEVESALALLLELHTSHFVVARQPTPIDARPPIVRT